MHFLSLALGALLALAASAQMAPTLPGGVTGPPPDVVAVFIGQNDVSAVSASGAFSLQGSGAASQATSGTYLSHVCNPDSTFDAVWAVSQYTSSGGVGTPSYYCEHGLVNATTGVYTSYTMQTMTCPLTAPYTGATTSTSTEVPGSNLGDLLQQPFCNKAVNSSSSSLVHANAYSAPAPAPGPATTFPSPGTVSVAGADTTNGGTTPGASDSSSGRRLLRALHLA